MAEIEIIENGVTLELKNCHSDLEVLETSNDVIEIALRGAQGIQGLPGVGELGATWIGLATGWKTTPVLNTTIADGDVYTYVFEGDAGDVIYYRLVPSGAADDAFYSTFSGGVLSGLIAKKEIVV